MSSKREKFDRELEKFIGIEEEVNNELDELEDEDGEGHTERQTFDVVEYDRVESKLPAEQRDSDLYDDYEYSRTILRGLIERGTRALEGSLMLAKESEHPRAFEVTSTLMKNISDTTKDLMNLHKHIDEGASEKGSPKTQTNIQNNYYGSEQNNEKGVDDLLDDLDDDKPKRKPRKKK